MSGRAENDRETLGAVRDWLDTSVATFITTGTAGTAASLAINNPAASGRIVTLRRLVYTQQTTSATGRPVQMLKAIGALATGGTVLVKTEDRTSQIATTYVALGATASDGGVATAIVDPAGLVRVARFAPTGGATSGFTMMDFDGEDQSLEPNESWVFKVDLGAAENSTLTVYLTEKLGLR
jgi:hypothetical protein